MQCLKAGVDAKIAALAGSLVATRAGRALLATLSPSSITVDCCALRNSKSATEPHAAIADPTRV